MQRSLSKALSRRWGQSKPLAPTSGGQAGNRTKAGAKIVHNAMTGGLKGLGQSRGKVQGVNVLGVLI